MYGFHHHPPPFFLFWKKSLSLFPSLLTSPFSHLWSECGLGVTSWRAVFPLMPSGCFVDPLTHHDMLVPFCGKVCLLIFLFNKGSVVTVEPGLLMETSEDFLLSFWIPTVLRTSDEWRWLGDWAHAQVPGHSEKALLLANTLRVIINFE